MNILFFHGNAIHPNAGGISRITYNLSQLFRSSGYDVKFLSIHPIKDKEYKYDKEQYYLPDGRIDTITNIEFLIKFVTKNNIDLIINQSALNVTSIRFLSKVRERSKCKVISCFHNSLLTPVYNYPYQKEWYWKKNHRKWLFKLLRRNALRKFLTHAYIINNHRKYSFVEHNSDAIIFLCDGLRDEFERIIGHKSSKTFVIPNFTDDNYSGCKKENLILWIGTIDFAVKKIDFILKVWSKLYKAFPDWQLKILGDGAYMHEAEEFAETLGLQRCSFEGRVNPEMYYNKAKITCITSSHEAFPMVIIESFAHGVIPVVNNSFPAAATLINNNENGLLITPFSPDNYISSLHRLLESPKEIYRMSANALESSKKYSGEKILIKWISLFNECKK